MISLLEAIFQSLISVMDECIFFFFDLLHLPRPAGWLLILLRIGAAGSFTEGCVFFAAGIYEAYASGIAIRFLDALRFQHPYLSSTLLGVLMLIGVSGLVGFRENHKAGYGFFEFLCGMTSVFLLLLVVVKGKKELSDGELIVALLGSIYLASEGLSIPVENVKGDESASKSHLGAIQQ